MFRSDYLEIRFHWPAFQGTWWAWTKRKLFELPFHIAIGFLFYILVFAAVLTISVPTAERFMRNFSNPGLKLAVGLFLLIAALILTILARPVLDLLCVLLVVAISRILTEVLESLRNLLSEAIVFGCLCTLSYYQTDRNKSVFLITVGLQTWAFCILALSADFHTPMKRWMKRNCGRRFRRFLARTLKLKYFRCSNPFEENVFTTHLFLTNGNFLNVFGLELDAVAELDRSYTGKVSSSRAGPLHTQFTIEGVPGGIIVETSPKKDQQREILEYMAHHPEACFVKEICNFRGTYCSIDEYPKLLSSETIYVCRLPKTGSIFRKERDLDMFAWMGKYRKYLPKLCVKLVGLYVRYTGVYSPIQNPPLVQKRLSFTHSILGFGSKFTWRVATPSDGILML